MQRYSNEKYWNEYWKSEYRDDITFYFSNLVDQYIEWDKVKNYMEVGGAPGSIMAYMNKNHFLEVSTIDFSDKEITEKFLNKQGVRDYKVYQEDFENTDLRAHKGKYDLVASWGFIEHFSKDVCNKFIKKHKDMVSDNGYLILELPNIRKIFWLMYFLFNHQLLKIHNFSIIDVDYLKEQMLKGGEFKILYAGYYLTMNYQNDYFKRHSIASKICDSTIKVLRRKQMSDKFKSWCFPYLILIARKNGKRSANL